MDYNSDEFKKINQKLIESKYQNKIYESKNYGSYKVIGAINGSNHVIEFIETGFQTIIKGNRITDGAIKDLYKPNLLKKGYCGRGPYPQSIKGNDTKEYILWQGIITRCYAKQEEYKFPKIDERWLCFQNFVEDIKLLKNYNEWKETNNFQLDKDILQQNKEKNKIYSKNTCLFVTIQENQNEKNLRLKNGKKFLGIKIDDGFEEEFVILKQFADKYNLNSSKIGLCLNNKRKTHKGWRFKIVE